MVQSGSRRIVVMAKNGLHTSLLTPVVRELKARGHNLRLLSRRTKRNTQVTDVWKELGWECDPVRFLFGQLRRGDVFLCCTPSNDTNWFRRIMGEGSITRIALNEGGRFMRVGKYNAVDVFLGWGPSAHELQGPRIVVTGSTAMEDLLARSRTDGRMDTVVINYKSNAKRDVPDHELPWLREAVQATRAIGMTPLISLHPKNWRQEELAKEAEISTEPIESLLLDCGALISRGSTVIHHGAAVGCQPFFFTDPKEPGAEYLEPEGAFPICYSGGLEKEMRAWRDGATPYDPKSFLDRHFDIDPNRPALDRIIEAIEAEAGVPHGAEAEVA